MKTRRFSTSVLTVATFLGLLASPAFATVTPFTASSNPVAPGKTITFNARIDAGVTANGAKVTPRFYNSSGAHIDLASDTGVNFTAGTPTPVTISYNPAPPDQTITFNSSLNPGVAATGAKVTFWFYNSGGSYVGSASATGLTFTAVVI